MVLYRFAIDTLLSSSAMMARLAELARPAPGVWEVVKESFGWRPAGCRPFIGTIRGETFEFRRDIHYRNSFLPRIHGRVIPLTAGARLDVEMKLHPVVLVFTILCLGFIGTAGVFMLLAGDFRSALIPLAMLLFVSTLTLACFYPEAFKARRILEKSLTAAE